MMDKKFKKITLIMIILILMLLLFEPIYTSVKDKNVQHVKYLEFLEMWDKGNVKEVYVNNQTLFIYVEDLEGNIYKTDNPREVDFKSKLLKSGVDVVEFHWKDGLSSIRTMLITIIGYIWLILLILNIYLKFMAGLGKNTKMVIDNKDKSKITFGDVGGYKETKEDMRYIVDMLKKPKKYSDMGAKLPKGVILYGPPGNGKTYLVKALAGEANVPIFTISGSDFVELYVGVGAKRVRELFKTAREKAPCIVFIDEIDAVGGSRGNRHNHSENIQTINALLSELDGFEGTEGVLVIGATNRLEDLDPALVRPGRFDKHIGVGYPEYKDRLEILELYMDGKSFDENINKEDLAKITVGFSGSGLATLINESAIIAVSKNHKVITQEDIDDAYFKMMTAGNKKGKDNRKQEDLNITAWHEAGHALTAKLFTQREVNKVSIVASTSGVGGITYVIPEDISFYTKEDILNDVRIFYGGRVGEYIYTGDKNKITTGAKNDIEEATKRIYHMIKTYGMSDEFGMLNLDVFERIDDEIVIEEAKKISNKLYEEVMIKIKENKDKLERIANKLLEKETIDEKELDEIIQN